MSSIENTKKVLRKLESKNKVKVNWETGDIELCGKDQQENDKIYQKIAFSSPQACLKALQNS
jgi:hypothetical protein